MTPTRTFPYGGVPVYNPQSLSKPEAIAQFHARQDVYKRLLGLLREERPSHVLIIGTRGMGKTTLLQRVHYGVEDDNALNERFVVLEFPEEQYNVNRLHHFLLNTVDALADAMEKAGDQRMLTRVEAFADKTGKLTPQEIEEQVPKFLAEIGKDMSKSFLLLVDNADRLFDTIQEREQWQLRELLSNREDLTLFGATTQASEGIYGPKRAFFEFFKIETLTPLSVDEVRNLLLQLSESVEESEKGAAKRRVQDWLDADPGRLRTLVQLTGGNPRTTVLLFHLVLDGLSGGAREYLEQLLDQCTPNYKGRIDELPAQAQQILDAVALRWDPVTAMDIATDTKLETSAVSTQLTRLVRQGLLEKADPGESKKALYQVAERFFNIWYLIRASRRVRAKLRWFVESRNIPHREHAGSQDKFESAQDLRWHFHELVREMKADLGFLFLEKRNRAHALPEERIGVQIFNTAQDLEVVVPQHGLRMNHVLPQFHQSRGHSRFFREDCEQATQTILSTFSQHALAQKANRHRFAESCVAPGGSLRSSDYQVDPEHRVNAQGDVERRGFSGVSAMRKTARKVERFARLQRDLFRWRRHLAWHGRVFASQRHWIDGRPDLPVLLA